MKRQTDWEEAWQSKGGLQLAGADRWAPWFALVAAVLVVGVAGGF